jgi:hypothetical protein
MKGFAFDEIVEHTEESFLKAKDIKESFEIKRKG